MTWIWIYFVQNKYLPVENRQRGRFAGFSLYVSYTGNIQGSTLCYKDLTHLPPLNFTTICTEHGRYIIFYNERLNEMPYPNGYELDNVYTELCEVIVKGTFNIFWILGKMKIKTFIFHVYHATENSFNHRKKLLIQTAEC